MEKAERDDDKQAETCGKQAKQRLGKQVKETVKNKRDGAKRENKRDRITTQSLVEPHNDHAQRGEGSERISNKDRPQKILRFFQITVQQNCGPAAGPNLLANAQPAQRKNPSLHSREKKGEDQTNADQNEK